MNANLSSNYTAIVSYLACNHPESEECFLLFNSLSPAERIALLLSSFREEGLFLVERCCDNETATLYKLISDLLRSSRTYAVRAANVVNQLEALNVINNGFKFTNTESAQNAEMIDRLYSIIFDIKDCLSKFI